MFRNCWPDKKVDDDACLADKMQDRLSALELNESDSDRDDAPSPVPFDDHHWQQVSPERESQQENKGVPVAEDDPEAYEDEPWDPFEEDWDNVVEIEEIKDPTWCFECYCTQTAAEGETNQAYKRLKNLRVEGMGKMSEIALCRTLQSEYNATIRPGQSYEDKAVSLQNWRDHPTKHTINADVVEEQSLKFLCALIRHIEKSTFRRNKRKHDQITIDDKKVSLWLKVEDRRKRLMVEHRNRQCSLI